MNLSATLNLNRPISFICFFLLSLSAFSQSSTASGGTFTNVARAGSSSDWSNLSNVGASDDADANNTSNLSSAGDFTDYLQVTDMGLNIPSGATINGIEISIERSDASGKIKDNRISVVKGGVIGATNQSKNPAWPSSDANSVYGGAADLWGETWTSADVNASNFGIAFSVQRTGGGGATAFADVDHISITVHHTGGALPIELLSFDVVQQEALVSINWVTATESNNDFFTIERSSDGFNYEPLSTIKGAGNSSTLLAYSTTDPAPVNGRSFYRLKQTDFNGDFEHFEAVSVEITDTEIRSFSLYPNPVSGPSFFVESPSELTDVKVQVLDLLGNIVLEESFSGTKSSLMLPNSISPGIYLVSLNHPNALTTERLVVR